MLVRKRGNIFTSKAKVLVNTINCEGVMGAGIAYEFRLRYPDMYERYRFLCEEKMIDIGLLWLYKTKDRAILNFPTKRSWKQPSKIEYIEKGLEKFVKSYKNRKIKSIAFPLLGADRGGMDKEEVLEVMERYLGKCEDIDVEIWEFDPKAKDELYDEFVKLFVNGNKTVIKEKTGLSDGQIEKIRKALTRDDVNSVNSLLKVKGLGEKTIEKVFRLKGYKGPKQTNIFDFM